MITRLFHLIPGLLALLLAGSSPARELEVARMADSTETDWRYDMRMMDFAGAVYGLLWELNTPELVERRMAELKAQGATVAIVNGLHMHLSFLDEWPRVTEYVRLVADTAHRHGMKVVFHHDVTVAQNAGKGINHLVEHPDWLQRDVEFDRPTLRMYCIMNPGFRKAYMERIRDFAKRSGVDGLMLDEAHFTGSEFCGCEHCRAAFTRDTGKVLPTSSTSRVFQNMDDPTWVAWLNWRREAVGDWWVELRKTLNPGSPRTSILNYITHSGILGTRGSLELALDLGEAARGSDSLGTEIMARNHFHNARPILAMRKIKSALGAHFRLPIWGIVYHVNDPTSAYIGWALMQMSQHSIWTNLDGLENPGRYLNWAERMRGRDVRPLSDVAVLFSMRARDFGRDFPMASDAVGFSETLNDAHIQHDFVLDEDLTKAATLAKYKLLIIPSAGPMGSSQVEGIREYVRNGGHLLVTANSSAQEESGARRDNFLLADLLGVNLVKEPPVKAPSDLRVTLGQAPEQFSVPQLRVRVKLAGGDGVKVLGQCAGEPAVTVRPEGKGQCVYVAVPIGTVNYEMELRNDMEKTFERNARVADLLVRLVRNAAGGPLDFQADSAPKEVGMSAFLQETGGKRKVLVHLLNMTGTPLRKGQAIPNAAPSRREEAFPALKEDVVFNLRRGRAFGGYVVSPDYQGRRPVAVARQPDGSWQVTVAKGDLISYSLVYLDVD